MAVAEQYRVNRGFKWMGTQYERGDSISRATILSNKQVGEARLGSLQRIGHIELDPVTRPIDKMLKADLIDYGREIGAEVSQKMLKADLIEAIRGEL